MTLRIMIACCMAGGSALGGAAQAQTLPDALASAYRTNPQLQAQRRETRVAQEQLSQARGQGRPQVELTGQYGYDNTQTNVPFNPNEGERQIGSAAFEASQPLYTGGRVGAGIRQARAGISVADAEEESLVQDIFLQTVTAYVDVRRDREALRIQESSVGLLEEQLRAARDRFDVGEVTRTDVAQAEARYEGAIANRAAAAAQLEASRATYMFLVGELPQELMPPPPAPDLPPTFELAVDVAKAQNPDVLAAQMNEEVAQEGIAAARANFNPELSLVALANATRIFEQDFTNTQFGLVAQARIPLYQGNIVQSQVREARLNREAARDATDNAERQVVAEVSQAWYSHIAALRAIEASRRQAEAAQIAFEGGQEELAVGVRTTLDVLDQEQDLLEARLQVVEAERDAYVAAHDLLRAMGALTPANLGLAVR